MIWQYTIGSTWIHAFVLDLEDQTQGVMFRRPEDSEAFKVLFAGNEEACEDWAKLTKADFFEMYSHGGLAKETCIITDKYLERKRA